MIITNVISNELANLIFIQHNLKFLGLINYSTQGNLSKVIPSLIKHSKHLIKLFIHEGYNGICFTPLSFVEEFPNLQELTFRIVFYVDKYFKNLQYVTLPQLQVLKFRESSPNHEVLTKFLEKHGENLKVIHLYGNNSQNLAIARLCPNLKSLYTDFQQDEMETLKVILTNCQQLESIKVRCDRLDSLKKMDCWK